MADQKKLRIFYLTGPADIVADYRAWKNPGEAAPTFGGGVFIEQFFQFCEDEDAQAQLVSVASGEDATIDRFVLEYRNPKTGGLSGIWYHLQMARFMAGILKEVFRFKPDVLIAAVADYYWFAFVVLSFLRFRFVPFFHCTLWPRLKSIDELSFVQRNLLKLTGAYLKRRCRAVLSITDVIREQMFAITGAGGPRVVPFRPIYDRRMFSGISEPDWHKPVFRVLFAGRVSREKGVYALLDVARLLKSDPVAFDICGDGDELDRLREVVAAESLAVTIHGVCDRPTLKGLYSESHAVVVPSTRDFPEGFNRVSIEAVICGRPVIVSTAAAEPAISSAAIVVDPDDVGGYCEAIRKLRLQQDFYDGLHRAAIAVREQFFDESLGWEAGLRSILAS